MFSRLFLIAWLAGCGGDAPAEGEQAGEDASSEKAEEKAQPDPRTLVEVAAVARGSVGSHLVASATVESEAQATLVPETTGVVTGIHAEEGDAVRKGQLLAVIASPTLDAAYQRASAELERATTEVETAERLFEQKAISRAELDTALQALKVARTAHAEASQTRGFTRLESPIDGTVATRTVRYGEMAGGQPAFTVVDLTRLRAVVNLPERDLARVRPGLVATLASAYDVNLGGAGTVERVSPVVDPTTGTFRATIRLDPTSALRPGQFVSVRVEVDRHADVLTVPRRALVWEEGKAYVFRLAEVTPEEEAKEKELAEKAEADDTKKGGGFSFSFGGKDSAEEEAPEIPGPKRKVVRAEVKVGFEDGETAEVLEGLAEDDQVVVVGNQALRDGARVRLPGDPTLADAKKAEADKEAGEKAAGAETEGAAAGGDAEKADAAAKSEG